MTLPNFSARGCSRPRQQAEIKRRAACCAIARALRRVCKSPPNWAEKERHRS